MSTPYEELAKFILPSQMLDWFELTKIELTKKGESSIVNLYLTENDVTPDGRTDLRPNGYTAEKVFHDFPIRGQEVLLHVKRRRWTGPDGRNVMSSFDFIQESTRCSRELADFLKEAYGDVPYNGPFT